MNHIAQKPLCFVTQEDALNYARQIAKDGRNGTVGDLARFMQQQRESYGVEDDGAWLGDPWLGYEDLETYEV